MARVGEARGPHLVAIDQPAIDAIALFRNRAGIHPGRVGAMMFLGQAKGAAHTTLQHCRDIFGLLLGGAEVADHKRLD